MKKAVFNKSQALALSFVMLILMIALPLCSIKADAARPGMKVSVSQNSYYVGGKITVSAYGTGGTAPYTYKFIYRVDSGSWITLRNFGMTNTVTFTMGKAGKYTVRAYVMDKTGSQNYMDQYVTCKAKYVALTNNSTINAMTVENGRFTTVYGKASGGTAPYKYAYYYTIVGGTKKTMKDFSTSASVSMKLPAGYYKVDCVVKDSMGNTATKSFCGVTVKKNTGLTLKNISTSAVSISDVGSSVTLNGKATGGYQPYRYSFYYSINGGSYQKIAENLQNPNTNLKLNYTGYYTVKTVARDIAGNISTKYLYITSRKNTGKALLLSASSDVSDIVDQGGYLTLKASASYGVQPYKYAYYYKLNTGSWQLIKAFGVEDTAKFKVSSSGNYVVKISVKDSAGKVVDKTLSFESISRLGYKNTTVDKYKVNYGFSQSITAQNKGSTAKYAFYYKKTTDYLWSKLKDYSTSNTASFRPRELAEYTVMVRTTVGNVKYTSTYIVTPSINANVYELHRLINAERKKAGVPELQLDTDMVFISGVRAEELNKSYSHTRPDKRNYYTVFNDYDVGYLSVTGENNASNPYSPADVVKSWMNSPKHKVKILNPEFTKQGVNFCGRYWNELFAG